MEAARIDGASEFRLFFQVVLPLGLPAIASLAIFQVLFVWNDLLVGLVLAQENQPIAPTIAVAAAPVRLEPRRDRAGLVLLGDHPADDLRALPALLRPGPARRLRQVARMTERVAIVGAGLGGFVAYATLRHAGLEPGEIAVFGDEPDPAGAWRPRAAAIRQQRMRSESDGHCFPTTFPGLAAREAARRRDLAPLLLSVCDRYRPTVARVPAPRRRAARAQPAGTRASCPPGSSACAPIDGGFDARRSRRLPPRPARAGPSRASRSRRSSRATRASCTPTSRTSTPRGSPSSARAWPPRPSG